MKNSTKLSISKSTVITFDNVCRTDSSNNSKTAISTGSSRL